MTQELAANSEQAYDKLQALIQPVAAGKRPRQVAGLPAREVVELLRTFAKSRFQSQLLLRVSAAFLSLRGHLSDQLREVGFCRTRLNELLHQLEDGRCQLFRTTIGKQLFPSGCGNLSDAVEQFLSGVTPEMLQELDDRMEEMIKQKFTALVNICLGNTNALKTVEQEMLETSRQFVEELLTQTNAAQLFLEQEPDPHGRCGELNSIYDEATPELPPPRQLEPAKLTLLAAPAGEAGDALRELAHEALPDVEIHPVASTEDVVLYRELVNLPLSEVAHLGSASQLIYRQMTATDNFTPHTRTDVKWQKQG